jgi:hypothetical protein
MLLLVLALAAPELHAARKTGPSVGANQALEYARRTFRAWAEEKLGAYPQGFWDSVGHQAKGMSKAAKVSVSKLDAELRKDELPPPPPHSDPDSKYSKENAGPCKDIPNFEDVMGHGCDVYEAASSKDERMCYGGEPRMPTAFYMLFADEAKGNAIEACCACGKGNPKYTESARAWNYPVHEPGPDECVDLHGWADSQGSDCAAYAYQCLDGEVTVPMQFVSQYKDQYGLTAVDACCKCGRAAPMGADACYDDDWTGPEGEKCYWLSDQCRDGNPLYPEEKYKLNSDGINALSACCMCGGGLKKDECRDTPGWKDNEGYGCSSYSDTCMQGVPLHNMHHYEEFASEDGRTAVDSCCVCGGGEGKVQTCKTYTEWVDAKDQNCDSYGTLCEGEAPRADVSTDYFLKVAHASMSALDACCNCGGGHNKSMTCHNDAGWKDKEGYGCQAYPAAACIGGKPMQNDVQYTHVADENGVSALDACCHCGGGTGGPMCADMTAWTDAEGKSCNHYEETAQCKDGYPEETHSDLKALAVDGTSALEACCACGGGVGGQRCHSNHVWKYTDDQGHDYTCDDYDTNWCKGGEALHHFAEYTKDAVEIATGHGWVSALDACCQCGGGIGVERCENDHAWRDKSGFDCDKYRDTCSAGFPLHVVANYYAEADANGKSALEACCKCGGGAGGPRCLDSTINGATWVDDDGYGCHDYESVCIAGAPNKPPSEFTSYATKTGISALDACCRCGGGTVTRTEDAHDHDHDHEDYVEGGRFNNPVEEVEAAAGA